MDETLLTVLMAAPLLCLKVIQSGPTTYTQARNIACDCMMGFCSRYLPAGRMIALMAVAPVFVSVRPEVPCQYDAQSWDIQNPSGVCPVSLQFPLSCLSRAVQMPKSILG